MRLALGILLIATAVCALLVRNAVVEALDEMDEVLTSWAPPPIPKVIVHEGGIVQNCEFIDVRLSVEGYAFVHSNIFSLSPVIARSLTFFNKKGLIHWKNQFPKEHPGNQ
jgi:hypothetical protein